MRGPKSGRSGAGWNCKALESHATKRDILAELDRPRRAPTAPRPISPMKPAPDAALLDTTDLDIDAAFAAALALVKPKIEAALKAPPQGLRRPGGAYPGRPRTYPKIQSASRGMRAGSPSRREAGRHERLN